MYFSVISLQSSFSYSFLYFFIILVLKCFNETDDPYMRVTPISSYSKQVFHFKEKKQVGRHEGSGRPSVTVCEVKLRELTKKVEKT